MEHPSVDIDNVSSIPINEVQKVIDKTKGYSEPDEESEVIAELEKGQTVIVITVIENNWCQILSKSDIMYIKEEYLTETSSDSELVNELSTLETARVKAVEMDIAVRKGYTYKKIGGAIIFILIIVIFLIGSVTALRSSKNDNNIS